MIGTDIIEIDRIKDSLSSQAFITRVFTQNEIKDCNIGSNLHVSAARFAVRFAAKEAVFKAVDVLDVLNWQEISIYKKDSGKPFVKFFGKTKQIVEEEGIRVSISLSHCHSYAVATAISQRAG